MICLGFTLCERSSVTERKTPYDLFGVECGKGWKGLYQPLIDLCNFYGIPILQVKEKFGGLRFYTNGVDDRIDALITAAAAASYHTCEDCGVSRVIAHDRDKPIYNVTTTTSKTSGWIRSLCAPCREAWDDSRRPK
jgi:hypothetical protein